MILSSLSLPKKKTIYGKRDPRDMWNTLEAQLNSMNSSVGPFLLRSEFLKSKYTGDGPISTFLAQVREHYTRLSSTQFAITEADLMTHVLMNDILPKWFEQTVKYL